MSIAILLLSLAFALAQTGLVRLLLAGPLAAEIPAWLLTGGIFALGMLLSFAVIVAVGGLEISRCAATFVRSHFGRTLALGALSVLLAFALAAGGEALYQASPAKVQTVVTETKVSSDICFVLDYSRSMRANGAEENMKAAFAQVIGTMPDGQRVCVVGYGGTAETLQPWTALDADTRAQVIDAVQNKPADSGSTNFSAALAEAGAQAQTAVDEGLACSVIMLSDGECPVPSVKSVAPQLTDNKIPVYTMFTGDKAAGDLSSLRKIAEETGGEMKITAADMPNLSAGLKEITRIATGAQPVYDADGIPDTLLTGRDSGRRGLMDMPVMRMAVLFIVSLVFKLTSVICMGDNRRFSGHFLHAFCIAVIAAAAVEYGYALALPTAAVLAAYWILMMNQIVLDH